MGTGTNSRTPSAPLRLRDDTIVADLSSLRADLDQLLAQGPSRVVIDVSEVRHYTSAIAAALLLSKRRCQGRGVELVIHQPSRRGRELLQRVGLAAIIES